MSPPSSSMTSFSSSPAPLSPELKMYVSLLAPPMRISFPSPPYRVSSPSLPYSSSLLALPNIIASSAMGSPFWSSALMVSPSVLATYSIPKTSSSSSSPCSIVYRPCSYESGLMVTLWLLSMTMRTVPSLSRVNANWSSNPTASVKISFSSPPVSLMVSLPNSPEKI